MRLTALPTFALALALFTALPACKNMGKKGNYAGSGTDSDYVNGTPLPERQDGVSFFGNNVDRNKFAPVYFGFDSYSVEGQEQSNLDTVASSLKSEGGSVIIAGFTDERGTPEYNRSLGERRAGAVRDYLIGRGVDAGKLQTVSFGADMPASEGHDESAWAKNRRAEFGLVK
jgi:peptidoglycan-associated lipoprotein